MRPFSLLLARKCFQQGGGLPVLGIVALKPRTKAAVSVPLRVCILAVALFISAPADVAAEVRVGARIIRDCDPPRLYFAVWLSQRAS